MGRGTVLGLHHASLHLEWYSPPAVCMSLVKETFIRQEEGFELAFAVGLKQEPWVLLRQFHYK